MSGSDAAALTWDHFQSAIAAIAETDASKVRRDARLIEDLGLDSVALVELAVFLTDDLAMATLDNELEQRSWEGVTVGQIYDEYVREKTAAAAG